MSMRAVNIKQMQSRVREVVSDKNKNEIAFCHVAHLNEFSYYNKEQMNEQMRVWKPLFKNGTLTIQTYNHKCVMIAGKQFYTFVVQTADLDKNPMNIDVLGLAFDNEVYMVSGHIYCFKTEANRDSIYKYLMGIKA